MTILLSALAFFVLLTLLVLVHELGHFMVAKWSKVTVEEFGFGLPPKAKSLFTWKGTLFSLNWIPFGGFVRLQGETSLEPEDRFRKGSFAAASIPSRLLILLAGVFMNFLLAVILITLGFSLWKWAPTYLTIDDLRAGVERQEVDVEWELFVSEVAPDGGASKAGVITGGLLDAVNGTKVTRVEEVLNLQKGKSTVEYSLLYPTTTDPESYTEQKNFVVNVRDGMVGIAFAEWPKSVTAKEYSFSRVVALTFRETWVVTIATVKGVGRLLTSLASQGKVPPDIAGVIGIAKITHATVKVGFMKYLSLVAQLSLSLAALNVLPFPALDGGRMLFVLIEMCTGRPVYRRLEVVTNGLGFLLILLLIVAVTVSDLFRIFSPSSL